jgi:phosphoribosyl 1,2-cyclic phosphodiesterase
MIVKILASGSDGNMIYVQSGETQLLVDIGISKTKAEKVLLQNDIVPHEIKAIFVTHEHGDHIRGLVLANKYMIPVWATEGTWKEIEGIDGSLKRIVKAGEGVPCSTAVHTVITPFVVSHDAYEPVGYVIENAEHKLSICLDTGTVTDSMIEAMMDSSIYVFECNHDTDMLQMSMYAQSVKARIASDIGHLSNMVAARALARLVKGRGEQIYLTHMSKSNNLAALALGTVMRELRRKGLMMGKDFFMEVV